MRSEVMTNLKDKKRELGMLCGKFPDRCQKLLIRKYRRIYSSSKASRAKLRWKIENSNPTENKPQFSSHWFNVSRLKSQSGMIRTAVYLYRPNVSRLKLPC